jgi:hypothetical protein
MDKIDKFIQFLFERIDDDAISVSKKMKYGHRYYYLYLNLDSEEDNRFGINITSSMSIIIDNRNKCIEVNSINELVIESEELVSKWSDIFEEYISSNLDENIQDAINMTLSNAKDKSLLREYQMEKIFKKDDTI